MKLLKKLSLSLLSFSFLFSLASCNKNSKEDFYIERSFKGELVELDLDNLKNKVTTLDHMVLYLNRDGCGACERVNELFLNDYLKETKLKVYSYKLNQNKEEEGNFIKSIIPEDAKYLSECTSKEGLTYPCFSVPVMLILENGKTKVDALGTKAISKSFFEDNLVIDKKKNYLVKTENTLKVKKNQEATLIPDQKDVLEGIIYHTSSLDNNVEIEYYLKPFIEEQKIDVYLDIDTSLDNSYLEIRNTNGSVKEKERKHYMSFLDAYLQF